MEWRDQVVYVWGLLTPPHPSSSVQWVIRPCVPQRRQLHWQQNHSASC